MNRQGGCRWIPVLVVIAVLGGVLAPAGRSGAQARPTATAGPVGNPRPTDQRGSADLPMWRGNAAHTGVHPGPGPKGTPTLLWHFATRDTAFGPSVVDGVAYFGSDDGYLYAVVTATGQQHWAAPLAAWTGAAPAVVDGLVFVGTARTADRSGAVYALDARTGETRWRADGAEVVGSITVAGGTVYATRLDGYLSAYVASSGKERWRVAIDASASPTAATPTVADGKVFAAADRDGRIHALDAESGTVIWQSPPIMGAPVHWRTPAAVADGRLFIIGQDDATPSSFAMLCLDAQSGAILWSTPTGGAGSLIAAGGRIYNAEGGKIGHLVAREAASGALVWDVGPGVFVSSISGPALAGDAIYVASSQGPLYALDAVTGDVRWQTAVAGKRSISPSIVGGVVYVGSKDGLYAIGGSDGGVSARL